MAMHPFQSAPTTTAVTPVRLPGEKIFPGPRPHQPIVPPQEDSSNPWLDVPPEQLKYIIQLIASMENDSTVDLGTPHLRPIYESHALLLSVITMYSLLVVAGLVANLLILAVIIRRRLYADPVQACVLNINIASIFQLSVVLPLTLFILIVHNWLLGKFLCYTLPMMQDLPSYVIMLSLMVLSLDRQQQVSTNRKMSCVPTKWFLPCTWVISILLVLPYSKFITFIHLEKLGFEEGEMCLVSLENHVAPYMRGLFVILFLVPVIVSLGLMWFVRMKLMVIQNELSGVRDSEDTEENSPLRDMDSLQEEMAENSKSMKQNRPESLAVGILPGQDVLSQELLHTIDIHKEKRAQKFLFLILISHFSCVLPINVLKLVRLSVVETYENDTDFDLAYISLVFITFLPTIILPIFYIKWILIGNLWKELFKLTATMEPPRPRANSIFQPPTPRRNSEVENFREEVQRQVRDRQASLTKGEKPAADTKVMETVLLRRASIMSTVNDNVLLQPGGLVPQHLGNRRQSFQPTHISRKNSYNVGMSAGGNRRRYSVQHS